MTIDPLKQIRDRNNPVTVALREMQGQLQAALRRANGGGSDDEGVPFRRLYYDGYASAALKILTIIPRESGQVSLYGDNGWDDFFLPSSITLDFAAGTSGKKHAVYMFVDPMSTGTVVDQPVISLEYEVWTNETARATALVNQDGVLLKSSDLTRRWIQDVYYDGTLVSCTGGIDPMNGQYYGTGDPTNADANTTGAGIVDPGIVFGSYRMNIFTLLAGVLQVGFNTLGQLVAGAGAVFIDALGITLTAGTATANFVKWVDGSNVIASLAGYVIAGLSFFQIRSVGDVANPTATVDIGALGYPQSGGSPRAAPYITMTSDGSGGQGFLYLGAISSGADIDTAIYGNSATPAIFVEGSSRNVGIGTITPSNPLEVNGAVKVAGLISNVTDPVSAQDAATKSYVDASLNNFDIKLAVRAASQSNLAFTRSANIYTATSLGVLLKATIDSGWSTGAALAVGDRILLANQTSSVDNGIVTITNLGTIGTNAVLTRSTDMDVSSEVTAEMRVPVTEGTDANIDYKLSSAGPFTLNTTALPFTRAGGPPTGAAGGSLSGTYPNPTVATNANLTGDVTSTGNATTIGALKVLGSMIAAATIDLVTKVTGILPIANGGTGVSAPEGTYTPTLFNTTNMAASSAGVAQWMRVGSRVIVSGNVDVDPTATGACVLGISLPVATNMTTTGQCRGTACAPAIASECASIDGDATNDRATMTWIATSAANHNMSFIFMYQVI